MSSCLSDSEELIKAQREGEVRAKVRAFLRTVALNLAAPEGISGKMDLAFKVNRKQIIGEVMVELGKELQEE